MLRSVAVCFVLFCCVIFSYGCEFPDFSLSIKNVDNSPGGDCQIKVDMDHKKGHPWDVYINKTSDGSDCHQSLLLVVRKPDNPRIPVGYQILPIYSDPSIPQINSAKTPDTQITVNSENAHTTKRNQGGNRKRRPKTTTTTTPPPPPTPEPFPETFPSSTYQQPPVQPRTPPIYQNPPGYPNYVPPAGQQTTPVTQPTRKPPPYGYKYLPNHNYYKVQRHPKSTWFEAMESCKKEGTHLAVINSESEAQAIGNLIIREGTRNWDHWIGAHGIQDEDWLDIYNQTLKETGYDHWWPGQPDYAPGYAQCVIFKYRSITEMGFLDLACRYDAIFICEHDQ